MKPSKMRIHPIQETASPLPLHWNVPRLVISFSQPVSKGQIALLRASLLDMAELRWDRYPTTFWNPEAAIKEARKFTGIPLIVTLRSEKEGGQWNASETERRRLFYALLPYAHFVDIELASVTKLAGVIDRAKAQGRAIILSCHAWDCTPPLGVLERLRDRAEQKGADLIKIVTMAQTRKDVQQLARFTLSHTTGPRLITFAMGPLGLSSRLLFPALGSVLSYSYLGAPTAPGQLAYPEMARVFARLYPERREARRLP